MTICSKYRYTPTKSLLSSLHTATETVLLQNTFCNSCPAESVDETWGAEGQYGEQFPKTHLQTDNQGSVSLKAPGIHNLGINNYASSLQMGEHGHGPITGIAQPQERSNSSATYFQVTTWLTSLRRSTWTASSGTRTGHETFEQLINQHTTRAIVDPRDDPRDDLNSTPVISSFASQAHYPTWLPSFRRSSWNRGADSFAVIGEPLSEAVSPSMTGFWGLLYGERSSYQVGPRTSVESTQSDFLESPAMETEDNQRTASMSDTPVEGVLTDAQAEFPLEHGEPGADSDWNSEDHDVTRVDQNNGFETRREPQNDRRDVVNEMPGAWYSEEEVS